MESGWASASNAGKPWRIGRHQAADFGKMTHVGRSPWRGSCHCHPRLGDLTTKGQATAYGLRTRPVETAGLRGAVGLRPGQLIDRRSFGVLQIEKPFATPVTHGCQKRSKFLTCRRKAIFGSPRVGRVSLQDAMFDHRVQSRSKSCTVYARIGQELFESPGPEESLPEDQDDPAIAENAGCASYGAGGPRR